MKVMATRQAAMKAKVIAKASELAPAQRPSGSLLAFLATLAVEF
jgi:hypothetical protein